MIPCLIVDNNPMARLAIRNYIDELAFLELAGECENSMEAIALLQKTRAELLFLSVEMQQMVGLKALKDLPYKILVIIVASKADYAVEAFNNEVFDYLLKPVKMTRFLKAVYRAKDYLDQVPQDKVNYLFLRIDNILTRIDLKDIFYVKAMNDYIRIATTQKKYLVRMTLKNMLEKLPDDRFFQIHRSYIAALDKIDHFKDNKVVINGQKLPVSDGQRNKLLKRLDMFY